MREKEEARYTMKEVSEATGIKSATLQGRRKRLGIESNRGGVHPGRDKADHQAAAAGRPAVQPAEGRSAAGAAEKRRSDLKEAVKWNE